MAIRRSAASHAAGSATGFDVVAFGEPMYEFSQVPGTTREYLQGFGGDTMNCAIAAARQGARVAYVSGVGDDEFGRQLMQLWQREGVDASGVKVDHDAHTAVYFISHGAAGHTFSYLRKNSAASRFSVDDWPAHVLPGARYFYTSGITQAISHSACQAAFAAIEIARREGVRTVFDANVRPALWPAVRAREIVGATIPLSDYFLLSLEDAQLLTGSDEPDAILQWCVRAGSAVTILKLGANGVVYHADSVKHEVRGHRVHAVDATGAGDCFAGALMARLAAGEELDAAVNHACAAAALACTGFGAVDPLPSQEQVFNLLEESASGQAAPEAS